VAVVDNGSVDGTREILRTFDGWLKLIEREGGHSLSNNINIVLRMAEAKYFLIMNPDVELPPDGIAKLYDFMEEHEDAGACGPKLANCDGSLQLSCRRFPTPWIFLVRRTPLRWFLPMEKTGKSQLMADWDHKEVKQVDWVIGACTILRKEALDQIGYYDERFRLYCEEIDLCYRLWEQGWLVYYDPRVAVVHDHQLKSLKKLISIHSFWHYQSMLQYVLKHKLAGFRRPQTD